MRLLVVALAATAMAVMGCGGRSDSDQAKQTAVSFAKAYRAHDAGRVCSLLPAHTSLTTSQPVCRVGVFTATSFNPPANPVVSDLSITGDHAVVTLRGEGPTVSVELVKQGGGWRVEGL